LHTEEYSLSLSETHLETVIVKLASELVVMLCNGLTCSGATLAKHSWKVSCLRVDLLFTSGISHVVFEGVWVNYGLNFGSSVVDHVVGGSEVAPLKSVLSGPMPSEYVMLDAALTVDHRLVVVGILSLSEDHFT